MSRIINAFILVLLINALSYAGVIHVPGDQASIQAGIEAAVHGDTVLVADGTYLENINFKGKAITVASLYLSDKDTSHISRTIIDGSQPSHPDSGSAVLFISGEDTNSVIYGFTITGGTGTITTTTYYNSEVEYRAGGGIFCDSSGARISYNIIKDNHISNYVRSEGAGVAAYPIGSDAFVIIEGNQIINNSTDATDTSGGTGIDLTCNARVQNNVIAYNEARLSAPKIWGTAGAGLVCWTDPSHPQQVVIDKNHIHHNTAHESDRSRGGGILLESGNYILSNNIIDHNLTDDNGGGIYLYECSAQMINNTIVMNSVLSGSGHGGGLAIINSNVALINSIVWGNQATINSQIDAANIKIAYSNIEGRIWNGIGNISIDPTFVDIAFFNLSDSSPCIGRGIESYSFNGDILNAPASDYDGNPRPDPSYSHPDMGAQENPLAAPSTYIQVPELYATIQAGIDAADNGDTVLVADGIYLENINFKGKAITVASYFLFDRDTSHVSKTIIDGSQPSHADSGSVVSFISGEDTNSVIYGFTITNGSGTIAEYADAELNRAGGGILCYQSGARIMHNIFINNKLIQEGGTAAGGAICGAPQGNNHFMIIEENHIIHNSISGHNSWGSGIDMTCNGRIENNFISQNTSTASNIAFGAIDCWSPTGEPRSVWIKHNQIMHNEAISGNRAFAGGVNIEEATNAYVVHNEISYNVLRGGTARGNGLFVQNGQGIMVQIDKNIIMHNTHETENGFGGGICLQDNDGSISVTNNIISHNSSFYGGGIRSLSSKAEIINNTIVYNTAFGGGGIFTHGVNLLVMNSILWGNTADTYPQIQGSVDVVYSDIEGDLWEGEGNINDDPAFVDTIDFKLSTSSPCIGSGTESFQMGEDWYYAPLMDIYNVTRPLPEGTTIDMGAVEDTIVGPTALDDLQDLLPTDFALEQNYPNPFNPTTTISYQLPITNYVELSIYNLLGQKVVTLVSEKQAAGAYQVQWNANGFASGIYYYQLETGDYVATKKLILLK